MIKPKLDIERVRRETIYKCQKLEIPDRVIRVYFNKGVEDFFNRVLLATNDIDNELFYAYDGIIYETSGAYYCFNANGTMVRILKK